MSRRATIGLAVLVGLAVFLRVMTITILRVPQRPAEENRLIAGNLRAGHGFSFTQFGITGPTAIRGPVYPMLVALLGPDNVHLLLAVNVICGAAGVVLAYDVARQWAGANAGWIAATLFAVWPTQVYAAALTQGLCLAVVGMLGALASLSRESPAAAIGGGVLGGLTALVEPLTAVPLAVAAYLLAGRGRRTNVLASIGVGVVLCLPWLYRNAIVFGRPMPLTSNFWPDAFLGNGENATGEPRALPVKAWPGLQSDRSRLDLLSPPDFDRLKVPEPRRTLVMRDETLDWIRRQPLRFLGLCWHRLLLSVGAAEWVTGTTGGALLSLYAYFRGGEVALALAGLCGRNAGRGRLALAGMFVALLVLPVLTLNELRQGVLADVPLLMACSLPFTPAWRGVAA